MRFPAVLIRRPWFRIVSRMDESLMADEEVASSEGLGADGAFERLFFGVCSAGGVGQFGAEEMHGWGRWVT
jgi:hypothetical protein